MYEKLPEQLKKMDGSVCGNMKKKWTHDQSAVSDQWQKSEQCR